MNRLPQEILDDIGALFSPSPVERKPGHTVQRISVRPVLASVSRRWQIAIERHTFESITLDSTEVDHFEQVFKGRRRLLLKSIKYRIILPTYSDVLCGRFERQLDRENNDEAISNALNDLFRILSSWDDDRDSFGAPGSIELEIDDIYSPKDSDHRTAPIVIGRPGDLRSVRYKYSYMDIQNPNELPTVPCITIFRTKSMKRRLAPRTAVHIASRLPNLRVTNIYVYDDERRYPQLRLENRVTLGQAMQTFRFPQSLQEISVKLDHGKPESHVWEPPSLWLGDQHLDVVGQNLREATAHCHRLRKLKVEGVVDWALLWPDQAACASPSPCPSLVTPFWQSLEELTICFSLTSPSGGWYFRGGNSQRTWPVFNNQLPPGYSFPEEQDLSAAFQYDYSTDQIMSGLAGVPLFRTGPRTDELQPLITAFAHACEQIPALKTATITTEVWNGGLDADPSRERGWLPWGIWYAAPGCRLHQDSTQDATYLLDNSKRRLVLDIDDWQPDPRLLRMLRNIGEKQHGDSLSELFLDHKPVTT